MFRSIPIFALAMTAGLAALVLTGRRPPEAPASPMSIRLETDAWFV